jgi:hypothetical protein
MKQIWHSEVRYNNTNQKWEPTTLIIPLSPPYPPLFEYADGLIDEISVEGNDLIISGWTDSSPLDLEQQFILSPPIRPSKVQLTSNIFNNHDKTEQRHGFQLRLIYTSNKAAELSELHTCVLTRSMLTPLKLIRKATDNGCQGFLKLKI